MKRIILLVLVLGLAGCGELFDPEPPPPPPSPSPSPSPPEPAKPKKPRCPS